jgi:hypothetical protein
MAPDRQFGAGSANNGGEIGKPLPIMTPVT